MDKENRGDVNLYRKKQPDTMAYKATKNHMVYCVGGSLMGGVQVAEGYYVILDDFGRSHKVLSPESFHNIYELVEDADCSEG